MDPKKQQPDPRQRQRDPDDRPDRRSVQRKTLWKKVGSAAAVVVGIVAVAVKATRRRP